jgi:hypothetical protein
MEAEKLKDRQGYFSILELEKNQGDEIISHEKGNLCSR